MARVHRIIFILQFLLVVASISGCLGNSIDDRSQWLEPVVVTDPGDRGYDPARPQIHDYWDGEETFSILSPDEATWGGDYQNFAQETRWPVPPSGSFVPPDGVLVPDGTASLSVTVTWSENPDNPLVSFGDLEFWMKPANTSDFRLVHDSLVSGETFEVPVSIDETDLPHQLVSAWEFLVYIRESDDPHHNWFSGTIQVAVDAHRGSELRTWPPHPDHWQNRTEIELVDEGDRIERIHRPGGFLGGFPSYIKPPTGMIVPWGTDRIEVQLHRNEDAVGDVELRYRAADSRNWTTMEPKTDGATDQYLIYVTDDMADSPHAEASLWEFEVDAPGFGEEKPPLYWGQFNLTAKAYKV